MKKARLIYTGKTDKLIPIFAKLTKNVSNNYQEETKENKIFVNFDKENELILEVKNDDEFVRGFIDGFNSRRSKVERWILARTGVKTKLEVEE